MKTRFIKYAALMAVLGLGFNSIGLSNAVFNDQEVIEGNEVTTGCWDEPSVPEHVYPPDGLAATPGSDWLNNPYMDWTDATTTCPLSSAVQYQYRSYRDPGLSSLAYQSGWLNNSVIPAPGTPDGDYYWQVRSFDGYNYSAWSSPWHLIVDRTAAGAGDVVINEIMWMGSAPTNSTDEWIELKNTTDSAIDLAGWTIDGAGSSSSAITITSGSVLAGGYFLVSHYAAGSSAISDGVVVDAVIPGISLANGDEQLTLKDPYSHEIDKTPVGAWAAGENGSPEKRSMERGAVPGDGTVAGNWHSCTDIVCNDTTYWDVEGDNYGTPRALNHSDNDLSLMQALKEAEEQAAADSESGEEEVGDNIDVVEEGAAEVIEELAVEEELVVVDTTGDEEASEEGDSGENGEEGDEEVVLLKEEEAEAPVIVEGESGDEGDGEDEGAGGEGETQEETQTEEEGGGSDE